MASPQITLEMFLQPWQPKNEDDAPPPFAFVEKSPQGAFHVTKVAFPPGAPFPKVMSYFKDRFQVEPFVAAIHGVEDLQLEYEPSSNELGLWFDKAGVFCGAAKVKSVSATTRLE